MCIILKNNYDKCRYEVYWLGIPIEILSRTGKNNRL